VLEGFMDKGSPFGLFALEWSQYLQRRGHQITQIAHRPEMVYSRDEKGRCFRWLLLQAEGRISRLTPSEREYLRRQLRHGRRTREQVYVVVPFAKPVAKVIVLSAEKAVELSRITSERGGVLWEE
jgi:hypothetical protein